MGDATGRPLQKLGGTVSAYLWLLQHRLGQPVIAENILSAASAIAVVAIACCPRTLARHSFEGHGCLFGGQ